MLKIKKKKCIHWTLYRILKASVSKLNINFHDNIIGERPNMYGLFGKATRTKLILSKKNMAAQLLFANMHLSQTPTLLEKCALDR